MGVAIKLKARHEFHYGDLHYKTFLGKENFPKWDLQFVTY